MIINGLRQNLDRGLWTGPWTGLWTEMRMRNGDQLQNFFVGGGG